MSGSKDSSLRAWDLRTGRARLVSTQHFGGVQCLALDASADGGRGAYYSGARDATVQVCPLPVYLFSALATTTMQLDICSNNSSSISSIFTSLLCFTHSYTYIFCIRLYYYYYGCCLFSKQVWARNGQCLRTLRSARGMVQVNV